MPGRDSHVVDILRADALLRGRDPREFPRHLSQEDRFELEHSCNGEQHGWIFRDQRRARQASMSSLFEKLQELVPDFSSRQQRRRSLLRLRHLLLLGGRTSSKHTTRGPSKGHVPCDAHPHDHGVPDWFLLFSLRSVPFHQRGWMKSNGWGTTPSSHLKRTHNTQLDPENPKCG